MGRRFTESEVLAMTRNRREDKALKEKLSKLSEERGLYHDNLKKERKKISQFCSQSRRTSGNSPCPDCQFLCEKSDHVTVRQMQRHNKPWSVTPSESTFNVLFKQSTFPSSESGERKFRRRAKSSRKSSDSGKESEDSSTLNACHSNDDTALFSREGSSSFKGNNSQNDQTQRPVSGITFSQGVNMDEQFHDYDKYSNTSRPIANRQFEKSPRIKSTKSKVSEKTDLVSMSFPEATMKKLTSLSKESKDMNLRVMDDEKSKTEIAKNKESEEVAISENLLENNMQGNSEMKQNKDSYTTARHEQMIDNIHLAEAEKERSQSLSSSGERDREEYDERIHFPTVEELPTEETDEKREQQYMLVYTIQSDGKTPGIDEGGNSGLDEPSKQQRIMRSQTSMDDKRIQIVNVAQEKDGTTAITLSHVEKQRPHTVAGGELIPEDPDLKSMTDVDHRDYLWFRGKKLHDYVKPQERYKHDPFKMKKREKLMKKLATETPVFAEDQREQILNVDLTFSKATRARLLKQLVEENSSKRQKSTHNNYEKTLNTKIDHFMKSIEDFCNKQREN